MAALDLMRLSEITGDGGLRKSAERALACFAGELEAQPSGHTTMLAALDLLLNGAQEVVITAPTAKAARPMWEETCRRYIPDKVVIVSTEATYEEISKMSALLEGRKPGTRARAYVCQNSVCKLPADSVEALGEQLRAGKG